MAYPRFGDGLLPHKGKDATTLLSRLPHERVAERARIDRGA